MRYSVKYSRAAIRDLDQVRNDGFEASQDAGTASRYVDELMDLVEAKADFPESGSPLNYIGIFTGYRFVVFKAYIAFYRLDGHTLFVDRVLHGKSDYLQSLIPLLGNAGHRKR